MIQALLGVLFAAALFGALMWSIYRAVLTEGHVRLVAGLLALMTVFAMACISLEMIAVSRLAGGILIGLAGAAIRYDPGWSKLLPLVQLLFGIALALGLPWSAA